MSSIQLSPRAALMAVITALVAGIVVSLAIRPPGRAPAPAAGTLSDALPTQVIRWKMPSAFGTNLPVIGESILYFADSLSKASGGAIRLEPFEPGELVPALAVTDAVKEGKVEAGMTWLGYDQGRIPASPLLASVPFGMEPWEFMAWWYEAGGQQLGTALYERHNTKPLLCGLLGPETAGWFRKPIESTADLDGLKIRFAGLGGQVLQRLGASVTVLPAAEIFQALEKGAIDATEFSQPVVDKMLGFDRVAKYNYFPGWHQPFSAMHLIINMDRWNGLTPQAQSMIEIACTATVARYIANSEAAQGEVVQAFAQAGVTVGTLPRDTLEQLRRAATEVLDAEAAADGDFARILASQREFSQVYGAWKRVGYLPRDF